MPHDLKCEFMKGDDAVWPHRCCRPTDKRHRVRLMNKNIPPERSIEGRFARQRIAGCRNKFDLPISLVIRPPAAGFDRPGLAIKRHDTSVWTDGIGEQHGKAANAASDFDNVHAMRDSTFPNQSPTDFCDNVGLNLKALDFEIAMAKIIIQRTIAHEDYPTLKAEALQRGLQH
jgi:hypothetical protein